MLMPLFLALSGCVTVARNYLPQRTEISEPPLNAVNTAHVGDNNEYIKYRVLQNFNPAAY